MKAQNIFILILAVGLSSVIADLPWTIAQGLSGAGGAGGAGGIDGIANPSGVNMTENMTGAEEGIPVTNSTGATGAFAQPSGEIDYREPNPSGFNMTSENMTGAEEGIPLANTTGLESPFTGIDERDSS
jgi:hypothetical protein